MQAMIEAGYAKPRRHEAKLMLRDQKIISYMRKIKDGKQDEQRKVL